MAEVRKLNEIAADIAVAWGAKVNFGARPYLDAMFSLDTVNDDYGYDSGVSIVAYFLANARTFKGPEARALKAELKAAMRERA